MARRLAAALVLAALVATSCGGGEPRETLEVGVTTTLRDSGLAEVLRQGFEDATHIRTDFIAMGTGAILKMAQGGDLDLVLSHSPAAELRFLAAGHGRARRTLFVSRFLVVGPARDPALVRAAASPVEAMRRIASGAHPFVSRGDDSGTHARERELWELGGRRPREAHYVESGRGMGPTLLLADEMDAYTLVDSATWARFRARLRLVEIWLGAAEEPLLENPYSLITLTREREPGSSDRANRFVDFLASDAGRRLVREFSIGDQHPFRPLPPH